MLMVNSLVGFGARRVSASAWDPSALFASSEQGVWLDPSDLTTMFQDRAGTTPVTADGQTVGKILDKSGRGNHLVAPSDAARPLYKTDGTYHWLQCDGVDDTLYTPSSVTMGNTHKVSMWLGATRTSTNDAIVAQISDDQYCSTGFGIQAGTKNDGIYQAWSGRVRPDSSANEVYFYSDNVVVNQKQTASMFINTDLATYTDQVKFNLNNAAKTLISAGPSAMSATGFSAYPLYIAGALGSYIGPVKLYTLIILMRESTTQERSDTETWVNGKTGAY